MYGKNKREKMTYGGGMAKKKMMGGGRAMYNKGGKAGTQPEYKSGEMPKCMPK